MEHKPASSQKRRRDSGASSSDLRRADDEEEVIEPLSNCPFFHVILLKSHVKSPYQLTVPTKFCGNLPGHVHRVFLTCHGKTWEMEYIKSDRHHRRFSPAWKQFVVDNTLKMGDACVFELIRCDEDTARFKVQILREPKGLMDKIITAAGGSSDNPIIL